jgi:hypothetical protein
MERNDIGMKSTVGLEREVPFCVPRQDRRTLDDRRAGYRGGRRFSDHPPYPELDVLPEHNRTH